MPGEGEDAVDIDIESDSQQASSSKKLQTLRPAIKDISEIFEGESTCCAIEKNKLLNNQRCSNRITKRSRGDRGDPSPVGFTSKKPVTVLIKPPTESSSSGSKTRRPWELWSVEDKNAFFEAICEYGKDFESIQSYIAQRSKKKGVATNMIKNKDQVRHFYYRTWHKISKYLEVTESVSKQTQELYGLVNYSELRKKIGGCLNEKNRQKLNELVFSGVTTVKFKGKKLRIKTPVCRALKKLNNVADTKEPETEKLPKEISVEFRPHTNNAWLHVQSLAQNPRVRTKVTLQKRLSSVIEYLQKRWKPYRLKRKEQILSSLPNSLPGGIPCDNPPTLRVKPASDTKICPLTLSVMDVASSSDLCLEKYLKLSHKSLCKDISKTKKTLCLNQKIQDDKQNDSSEVLVPSEKLNSEAVTDSDTKELSIQPENQSTNESLSKPLEETDQLNIMDVELSDHSKSSVTDSSNEESERTTELIFNKSLEECYKKSYLMVGHHPQWDMDNLIGQPMCEESEENSKQENILQSDHLSPKSLQDREKNSVSDYTHEISVEELVLTNSCDSIYYKTVRDGWTVEESGFLTFGELYLLLGKPATIVLEYEFESSDCNEDYNETECISTKKNMLKKVLEVAQNYFVDTKNKQVLGRHRSASKTTKLKTCNQSEKTSKDNPLVLSNVNETEGTSKEGNHSKENDALKTSVNISDNSVSSDKHIFAVPIAPRSVKPPDQNTLKEEIGKLLPGTRRGCRVRRKPLVVQRPLLPREGMPRPMTFVHIVPSLSSLTNVIPSNNAQSENKINMPSAKNVMQIIPSGLPIQVPIVKQVHAEANQKLVLQQNTIPISHVTVNSTTGSSVHLINDQNISRMNTSNTSAIPNSSIPPVNESLTPPEESHSIISSLRLPSPPNLDMLNLDLLSESQSNSLAPEDTFSTMQQMSTILDVSNSSTFSNITPTDENSFLEELGFSTKNKFDPPSGPTSFSENQLATLKQITPPSSPLNQPFKINPPDMQWFNGESTELSLNTFLNSLESPSKLTSTTPSLSMENSNFDPISRLAPVVDSQVRCLLDECSIDFITKFEDLADVINNSSNDSKQT